MVTLNFCSVHLLRSWLVTDWAKSDGASGVNRDTKPGPAGLLSDLQLSWEVIGNLKLLIVMTSPGKLSAISTWDMRFNLLLKIPGSIPFTLSPAFALTSSRALLSHSEGTTHSYIVFQSRLSLWFILRLEQFPPALMASFLLCEMWRCFCLPTWWWYCRDVLIVKHFRSIKRHEIDGWYFPEPDRPRLQSGTWHQKFVEPDFLHYSFEILTRARYRELGHTSQKSLYLCCSNLVGIATSNCLNWSPKKTKSWKLSFILACTDKYLCTELIRYDPYTSGSLSLAASMHI